eukprot:Lankesteria_metandrocarpae@DN5306_c0_g1_i3.p1
MEKPLDLESIRKRMHDSFSLSQLLVSVALFNMISEDKVLTESAKQLWESFSNSSGNLEKQSVKDALSLMDVLRSAHDSSFSPKKSNDRNTHKSIGNDVIYEASDGVEVQGNYCGPKTPTKESGEAKYQVDPVSGSRADKSLSMCCVVNSPRCIGTQKPDGKGPLRIFADGVFDLMHSGHFNAIRQARNLGGVLVVGVNSDADVLACKGVTTIYTQDERAELMRGCIWVDEVVVGTPYNVSMDFLRHVNCDYVAHGDDLPLDVSGNNTYAEPAQEGRLLTFPRTVGISSTALVCRLLSATANIESNCVTVKAPQSVREWFDENAAVNSTKQHECHVETPAQRILEFIGNRRSPLPTDKIVYVDGSFDILHVGHLRMLQEARKLGDYVVVGVHDDATVAKYKGAQFPVMPILERALNLLALRDVDEVILGAPWDIDRNVIKQLNIDVVVAGRVVDSPDCLTRVASATSAAHFGANGDSKAAEGGSDMYAVPKEMGIFVEVDDASRLYNAWCRRGIPCCPR